MSSRHFTRATVPIVCFCVLLACGKRSEEAPRPAVPAPVASTTDDRSGAAQPAGEQPGDDRREGDQPDVDQPPAAERASAPLAAEAPSAPPDPPGVDFAADAALLFRVAACGGDAPIPDGYDRRVVAAHCAKLDRHVKLYRRRWLDRAQPFFEELVPDDVPETVVYPFGGGDLLTALTVYPGAREITTLSLEPSGDARAFAALPADALAAELGEVEDKLRKLIAVNHSRTVNLSAVSRGRIPGQLIMSLFALATHGYQPTSLRYFQLTETGALDYLEQDDIPAALERQERKDLFAHMELGFVGPDGQPRVFRHIRANLANDHLEDDPRVIRHLEAKGRVGAMTKAASYLLWWRSFSIVRDYLLANMAWMVSDSTGIPPVHARKAGFSQRTFGTFEGPFLEGARGHGDAMRKLWTGNPRRPLPFRFGYPDSSGNSHLLVTARAGAASP